MWQQRYIVIARVFSLDGKQVLVRNAKLSVQPDVETEAFPLNLPKELASDICWEVKDFFKFS